MRASWASLASLFAIVACALIPACGSSGSGASSHPAPSSDAGESSPTQPGGGTLEDGGASTPSEAGAAAEEASAPDGAVNPTPTVSSWLGTNTDGDLPRVDITYQLAPFDVPAEDGGPRSSTRTATRSRARPATSSTDIGYLLPTGTYNVSYVGTGTLAVSGIGTLGGAWTTGERRAAKHGPDHGHARQLRELPHPRDHERPPARP